LRKSDFANHPFALLSSFVYADSAANTVSTQRGCSGPVSPTGSITFHFICKLPFLLTVSKSLTSG
jgi:hypothetical protein